MEQDINCLFSYDAMRLTPIGHKTVIVQIVMKKITSCHLSFSCWHLVSRSFST